MANYNIKNLDRDAWLRDTFPEWGTWLNEEIDAEVVPQGKQPGSARARPDH